MAGAADPVGPGPNVGTLDEVSLTPSGSTGNLNSDFPSISRDGRIVAFTSFASDLVADDTNATSDVFVRDATTGVITLISRNAAGQPANGTSITPKVSGNGRYVTFTTFATDLPGPAGATNQGLVYRYDLQTGATQLVSHGPNGSYPVKGAGNYDISSTGRYVVYGSPSRNLVSGDQNGKWDVFRWDALTDTTTLVSRAADGGGANQPSSPATVSTDGSVVYGSKATNIVPLDGNEFGSDIYYWDAATGTTQLITRSFDGGFAHGSSQQQRHQRQRALRRLRLLGIGPGRRGLHRVTGVRLQHGHRSDHADQQELRRLGGRGVQRLGVDLGQRRQIAYTTDRSDTVETGTLSPNVVVYDRVTRVNTWVSTAPNGTVGNNTSYLAQISGNGDQIAFASMASNLPRHNDTNKTLDVYVWTRTPDRRSARPTGQVVVVVRRPGAASGPARPRRRAGTSRARRPTACRAACRSRRAAWCRPARP